MWTPYERLTTLDFIAEYATSLNSYFYCPKDDPFVSSKWNEVYPGALENDLRGFLQKCHDHRITPIYGLNPPYLDPSSPDLISWNNSVIRKLRHVIFLGFPIVCLLFDDVPLSFDAVEKCITGDGTAEQHFVEVINQLHQNISREIKELWLCAPDYCFSGESPLTRALERLEPSIPLIWTGRGVFVSKVCYKDIQTAQALLAPGAKLIHWNNYPVNDVEQNTSMFNLGSFPRIEEGVIQKLHGLFVNPMRQCFANFPLYMTASQYLTDPPNYDRKTSWKSCFQELFGSRLTSLSIWLQEFSSPNFVDCEPKFLSNDIPPYALKFISAIFPVLESISWFSKVCNSVFEGKTVSSPEFKAKDQFPTVPNVPRNVKEVYDIVCARVMSLPVHHSEYGLLEHALPIVTTFEQRYPGRRRLSIDPADIDLYLGLMEKLIGFEQEMMLMVLNNQALDPFLRISAYSLRQSINRFTYREAQKWRTTKSASEP